MSSSTTAAAAAPLSLIEREARLHEEARLLLQSRVAAYQEGLAALARDHLPGIRRALAKAADIESRLRALVEANPDRFVKPRTITVHGTKIGYTKAKGKLGFDDSDRVVQRIKKIFPDQVELLIHVEEKPNKEALAKLPASDLKRLGCTLTDGGDEVVVKPVDGSVEKMVKALLKEASDAAADDSDQAEAA